MMKIKCASYLVNIHNRTPTFHFEYFEDFICILVGKPLFEMCCPNSLRPPPPALCQTRKHGKKSRNGDTLRPVELIL